jgi:Dehydrogenase E1 component
VQAGVCSAIIAFAAREERLIHKLFLKAEENLLRAAAWMWDLSLRFRIDDILTATLANAQTSEGIDPLLACPQHKPLISSEKLKQLYTEMLRLREESRLCSDRRKRNENLRFREAPIVGCTIDLRAEDSLITSTHFSCNTSARHFVLDGGVASVPLATGAALLHRIQTKGNLVVTFVGRKQTESSSDVLRLAHLQSLPIIYVQLETSPSKTATSARSRIQIPSIPVDKADVVAIYRVASEAIDKARRGAGPTVIQCVPFSLKRTKAIDHHSQDPIAYMEYYLRKRKLWSDELNRSAGSDRWAGDGRMASCGTNDRVRE